MLLEIEIFEEGEAQAKYLVRGYDDVYWTDQKHEVLTVIRQELKRIENDRPTKHPEN